MRVSWAVVAGLVVVLLGFYAVTPGDGWFSGLTSMGLWLGVGSSVCTAVLLLALAACRHRAGPGPTVAVAFVVAVVSAAVLCAVLGVLPGPALWGSEQAVGGILYVGVIGTLVPVLLATWAVPVLGATRVAVFEVLAPAIAVVAALAWGEAAIGASQAAGIVLLLTGVALGVRMHSPAH
jgi:drug/metabolite transporter (DMT)-like permease